jgi:hypothetical protein
MFRWTHLLAIAQQFAFDFFRHTWYFIDILNSEAVTVGFHFHILHYPFAATL